MSQQEIWNSIAPLWKTFRKNPLPEAVDFLKNKKGRILDLGCGTGRHFMKNGEFYGVDFSEGMIKLAKKNKVKVKLFVASADSLPFEDNFFDSAIFIAALHCIETKEKREKALGELFRTLKQNSEALITVWSKKHTKLANHPKNSTIAWKKGSEELQRYYYLYDKEELEKLLKSVGFKVVSIVDDNKNIIVIVRKPSS